MIRTLTTITLLLVPGLTLARPQLSQEHVAQIERGDVLEFSQKSKGTKVMTGKAIGIIKDVPRRCSTSWWGSTSTSTSCRG